MPKLRRVTVIGAAISAALLFTGNLPAQATATALVAPSTQEASPAALSRTAPSTATPAPTAIDAKYDAFGGAAVLGTPKGPESSQGRDGGSHRDFSRGTIYWTALTGAHVNSGAIRGAYAAQGWELGALGYPTTDEIGGPRGGVYQLFQGGTIYWSPQTGAHVNAGAIRGAYEAHAGLNGALGFPTANEVVRLRGGGAYQSFEGGTIYWSPSTGAHTNAGAIRSAYAAQGWENGSLGYPTTDEVGGLRDGGAYQSFQGGTIYWSPSTGAHTNAGAIRSAYAAQGWENGSLGYPTSDEYAAGSGVAQDFQGGTITWPAAGGPASQGASSPSQPATSGNGGFIIPGAFCPDSSVGTSALASNGRYYTCGGKGADRNGHYHWNS